jgi:hypothetical protein
MSRRFIPREEARFACISKWGEERVREERRRQEEDGEAGEASGMASPS